MDVSASASVPGPGPGHGHGRVPLPLPATSASPVLPLLRQEGHPPKSQGDGGPVPGLLADPDSLFGGAESQAGVPLRVIEAAEEEGGISRKGPRVVGWIPSVGGSGLGIGSLILLVA